MDVGVVLADPGEAVAQDGRRLEVREAQQLPEGHAVAHLIGTHLERHVLEHGETYARPGTALGMPVFDSPADSSKPAVPVTIVREVPTDGPDSTLAVVMSGAALLVAAGTAGYARRSVRPGRPA